MMRCPTERIDAVLENRFSISALKLFYFFLILIFVVFEKKLPVLFNERFYDRKLMDFKLLVLWRVGIVECPLFERDISANKI